MTDNLNTTVAALYHRCQVDANNARGNLDDPEGQKMFQASVEIEGQLMAAPILTEADAYAVLDFIAEEDDLDHEDVVALRCCRSPDRPVTILCRELAR